MSEDQLSVVDDKIGRGEPDADTARIFEEEALRVVGAGKQKGVSLRIIGALAFHHHCPEFGYMQAKLHRVYTDIDFAGYGKQSKQIRALFVSLGYDEDVEINSFHAEAGRLIFNDPRPTSTPTCSWTSWTSATRFPGRTGLRSTRRQSPSRSSSSRRCRS